MRGKRGKRGKVQVPELPEVETIRRDLCEAIAGKRVEAVEVHGTRSVRRCEDAGAISERLRGSLARSVSRRGKYLVISLGTTDHLLDHLVVHLGMSGQLQWVSGDSPCSRHTHVVVSFDSGEQMRFVDPRTFGEVFMAAPAGNDGSITELAHLGFDALDGRVGEAAFGRMLAKRRGGLKALLMNQRFVSGIGNIYSDEILFAAGLRFDRSACSLSTTESRRLRAAMTRTLEAAIACRGSSLQDSLYRDLYGHRGSFQDHHQVYAREGQECRRCGSSIRRRKVQGRSTFMCEQCQR